MTTDYPVGTVVIATVRNVPGQQAIYVGFDRSALAQWHTPILVKGSYWHDDSDLANIEVVYTPRMAEPEPVAWQVVAHTESNLRRLRWFRLPLVNTHWYSELGSFCAWADLINPEPYRPDDAVVTP